MHLFVGTYTKPRPAIPGACGKGVVCLEVEPEQKQWRLAAEPAALVDPTYIAWSQDGKQLLSVADGGAVPHHLVALRLGTDGVSLSPEGKAETHGQASCHIVALPGQGNVFAVSSYLKGCLDTFRVSADGQVEPDSHYRYEGSSVHPRQSEPHAHQACVSPDGRWLYVCDLGVDCLWKHPIDPQMQSVGPVAEKIAVPAGEGPRHMLFDGKRAYVIAELTGRLLVFEQAEDGQGGLRFIDSVAGLPADYTGEASGAAIVCHPSGKAMLASQRRHNSVAFFVVDPAAGAAGVRLERNLLCHGKEPRDFTVDASGRWLFVANQSSDSITVFELDPATGLPVRDEPHFIIEVGTPVCVLARG